MVKVVLTIIIILRKYGHNILVVKTICSFLIGLTIIFVSLDVQLLLNLNSRITKNPIPSADEKAQVSNEAAPKALIVTYKIIGMSLLLCFSSLSAQNQPEAVEAWTYAYDVHFADIDDSTKVAYIDEGPDEEAAATLLFVHGL